MAYWCLCAGIFHCYMEYARLRGEAGSDVSLMDLGFQTDFRVYLHLRQTWMAFSESQPPSPAPSEAWEGMGGPQQLADAATLCPLQ